VFGPTINHRLFPGQARDFVLKELEEFDTSLQGALPGRKEVYQIGFRIFEDMERGDTGEPL